MTCLDRIYLYACLPILQTSSQVVAFLSRHLILMSMTVIFLAP